MGIWLTTDPLSDRYPGWSPYNYVANNPLVNIDPNGMEWYYYQADGADEKDWHYHEDTPEMEIWTGELDDKGNKIMQMTEGLMELLAFNGSSLTWYMENGTSQNWQAVSGVVDHNGNTQPDLQWVKDVGPIPEGQFFVNTDIPQLWNNLSAWQKFKSNVGRGQWPGGRISWGNQRYEIFPRSVGNRSGFFLHGGTNFGSKGCIDLAGCMSDFFYVFGSNKRGTVPLFVYYGR